MNMVIPSILVIRQRQTAIVIITNSNMRKSRRIEQKSPVLVTFTGERELTKLQIIQGNGSLQI